MERWAANTLRTLGIVLLGGFILVVTLVLLLCSMCSWGSGFGGAKDPDRGIAYLIAAIVVLVGGIWIEARLARSIIRSTANAAKLESPATGTPQPLPSEPVDLSPLGREAVNRLVIAMGAEISLSAMSWFWNQVHYWKAPSGLALHNSMLILLAPFVLYHAPYAILIYRLLNQPNRRTFAYSLAVPSILILQTLLSVSVTMFAYIHQPVGLLFIVFSWLIDIVILVLAWKAIQRLGIRPDPASQLVAAAVTFVYFFVVHFGIQLLYRLAWR